MAPASVQRHMATFVSVQHVSAASTSVLVHTTGQVHSGGGLNSAPAVSTRASPLQHGLVGMARAGPSSHTAARKLGRSCSACTHQTSRSSPAVVGTAIRPQTKSL